MLLYRFKLKNRDFKYATIDERGYKYLTEDPVLREMPVLENLREHSTSGAAVFQKWYRDVTNKSYQETIYLHKLLAEKFLGSRPSPDHRYVVHLNGDRLDNRIDNLAFCTRSELNRYARYNSASGYRGVRKEGEKFRAIINRDGNLETIGVYDNLEEAQAAYNEAARLAAIVHIDIPEKKESSKTKPIEADKVKKKNA